MEERRPVRRSDGMVFRTVFRGEVHIAPEELGNMSVYPRTEEFEV
jgi:hypothetical protein